MVPFLKWPGGKRWLVTSHSELLPRTFTRYIEPFLGSGAVFFDLEPTSSIIADSNPDLITMYDGIRDNWPEVWRLLSNHQRLHSKAYYYHVRSQKLRNQAARAARLIYLNRTCFNGIYRVNLDGEFNVPKGSKDAVLLDDDDFESIAQLLARAEILRSDFEPVIDVAGDGDLVFADPPYTVRHNNNAFIKYNETLFSWADQVRLANALARARERGALVVATNACHRSIRDLYRSCGFATKALSRYSSISADAESRTQFEEIFIRSKE